MPSSYRDRHLGRRSIAWMTSRPRSVRTAITSNARPVASSPRNTSRSSRSPSAGSVISTVGSAITCRTRARPIRCLRADCANSIRTGPLCTTESSYSRPTAEPRPNRCRAACRVTPRASPMAGQATPSDRRRATSAEMAAVMLSRAFTSARSSAHGSGDPGKGGQVGTARAEITAVCLVATEDLRRAARSRARVRDRRPIPASLVRSGCMDVGQPGREDQATTRRVAPECQKSHGPVFLALVSRPGPGCLACSSRWCAIGAGCLPDRGFWPAPDCASTTPRDRALCERANSRTPAEGQPGSGPLDVSSQAGPASGRRSALGLTASRPADDRRAGLC